LRLAAVLLLTTSVLLATPILLLRGRLAAPKSECGSSSSAGELVPPSSSAVGRLPVAVPLATWTVQ